MVVNLLRVQTNSAGLCVIYVVCFTYSIDLKKRNKNLKRMQLGIQMGEQNSLLKKLLVKVSLGIKKRDIVMVLVKMSFNFTSLGQSLFLFLIFKLRWICFFFFLL